MRNIADPVKVAQVANPSNVMRNVKPIKVMGVAYPLQLGSVTYPPNVIGDLNPPKVMRLANLFEVRCANYLKKMKEVLYLEMNIVTPFEDICTVDYIEGMGCWTSRGDGPARHFEEMGLLDISRR